MNNRNRIRMLGILAAFCLAAPCAAAPAAVSQQEDAAAKQKAIVHSSVKVAKGDLTDLIIRSKEVYWQFTSGEKPRISKNELSNAECIAVFPEVTKAAMVVGGQHGDGVVTCTTETEAAWSKIGFVDLRGASLGAQLGVESGSVVMLFNDEAARKHLKEGKARFGADLSYTFGDAKREVASDKAEQVVIYSDKKGAFASASLEGSYVVADNEELKEFYANETNTLYTTLSVEPEKDVVAEMRDFLILLPTKSS